jgi:hypothetical protein
MTDSFPDADAAAEPEPEKAAEAEAEQAAEEHTTDVTIALTPAQLVLVALGAFMILRWLRGRWQDHAARRELSGR